MQPLRQRLGEQVASLLLTAIRLYEFLPDERLPPEAELCAQLGVNRMAVREGLRWLEDHQYIHVKRGRLGGAYVVQPASTWRSSDSRERLKTSATCSSTAPRSSHSPPSWRLSGSLRPS